MNWSRAYYATRFELLEQVLGDYSGQLVTYGVVQGVFDRLVAAGLIVSTPDGWAVGLGRTEAEVSAAVRLMMMGDGP